MYAETSVYGGDISLMNFLQELELKQFDRRDNSYTIESGSSNIVVS